MSDTPKYPDVIVQLSGEDGNVFFIVGRVMKALRLAGHKEAADALPAQARACKSYDEVLQMVMGLVDVE